MLYVYAPWYINEGRLFKFVTPLVTVKDKKGNLEFMFTMEEYEEFRKKKDPNGTKYIYDYKKGLGSMEENEWGPLFRKYPLEKLLQPLHVKDSEDPTGEIQELINWLDDNPDFRKEKILKRIRDFDINKV